MGAGQPGNGRQYLQCRYCQSLVFPHGSPLTTDRITPLAKEAACDCPCCNKVMHTGEIDGHEACYCRHCYGVLMQNGSFGEVVRNRRAARTLQEFEDLQPIDPKEYDRSFNCPTCSRRMETHPYYGPGNVVIDSCSQCACVWLDHGELFTLERAAGRSAPQPKTNFPPIALPGATREQSPLETFFDMLF